MVSKASEDLPEPETPVTTVRRSCGISSDTFFKLWTRAPLMRMESFKVGTATISSIGNGRRTHSPQANPLVSAHQARSAVAAHARSLRHLDLRDHAAADARGSGDP